MSCWHFPARGLYELHMGWGLLEPLVHSHLGAIVSMLETLIKSEMESIIDQSYDNIVIIFVCDSMCDLIKVSSIQMMAVVERL